jgi:hypothetical protein
MKKKKETRKLSVSLQVLCAASFVEIYVKASCWYREDEILAAL